MACRAVLCPGLSPWMTILISEAARMLRAAPKPAAPTMARHRSDRRRIGMGFKRPGPHVAWSRVLHVASPSSEADVQLRSQLQPTVIAVLQRGSEIPKVRDGLVV